MTCKDTGEIIATRKMTDEENQMSFDYLEGDIRQDEDK